MIPAYNLHVHPRMAKKKRLQKTVTSSQAHKEYTPVKRCYVTNSLMPGRILSRKGPDSRHKLCLGDNIMAFYKGPIHGSAIADTHL